MDSGEFALMARAEALGGLEMRKQFEEELRGIQRRSGAGGVGLAGIDPRYNEQVIKLRDRLDQIQIEQERASGRYAANAPQVTGSTPREQVTTYRVQVGTGAGRNTAINTASQQDADALVRLLQQLEADAMRS
jgi:hypothetical protein